MLLADTSLADLEGVRAVIHEGKPTSVEEAAQALASAFVERFPSTVLARVFLVLPAAKLPAAEMGFARRLVGDDARLTDKTPVLTLLGTRGRVAEWNDRRRSARHLAIPLLDQKHLESIPMIARLLQDLGADAREQGGDRAIDTRRLLGGTNGRFYVHDAATARDERGRLVIGDQAFVAAQRVHTVFGMGGAYLDGSMAVAVVFTQEPLTSRVVDLFPSLIGNFKMATMALVGQGRLFA